MIILPRLRDLKKERSKVIFSILRTKHRGEKLFEGTIDSSAVIWEVIKDGLRYEASGLIFAPQPSLRRPEPVPLRPKSPGTLVFAAGSSRSRSSTTSSVGSNRYFLALPIWD